MSSGRRSRDGKTVLVPGIVAFRSAETCVQRSAAHRRAEGVNPPRPLFTLVHTSKSLSRSADNARLTILGRGLTAIERKTTLVFHVAIVTPAQTRPPRDRVPMHGTAMSHCRADRKSVRLSRVGITAVIPTAVSVTLDLTAVVALAAATPSRLRPEPCRPKAPHSCPCITQNLDVHAPFESGIALK